MKNRFFLIIAPLLLLVGISFYRYSNVILDSETTLAEWGDGRATVTSIAMLYSDFKKDGAKVLFSDLWRNTNVSFGMAQESWFPIFWKLIYIPLAAIFDIKDVWDVMAFLGMSLNSIAMFFLARNLTSSTLMGLAGGLIVGHLDFFYRRVTGHLAGLGTIFVPILACYASVIAGHLGKLKYQCLFGLVLALNIAHNEYYGYFGGFFCAFLYIAYRIFGWVQASRIDLKGLIRDGFCVVAPFVLAMFALYPNIFINKLGFIFGFSVASHGNIGLPPNYDVNAFTYYAVESPLSIFRPQLAIWQKLITYPSYFETLWEGRYTVGFSALVGLIFFLPLSINFIFKRSNSKQNELAAHSLIWFSAAVFISCFAIKPTEFMSFVPFTMKYFPFFRVSSRALMYVNLAVVVLLVCGSQLLWERSLHWRPRSPWNWNPFLAVVVIGLVLGAVFRETSPFAFTAQANGIALPQSQAYSELDKYEDGWLIELPVKVPGQEPPEANYDTIFYWTLHHKSLANMVYGNPPYKDEIVNFSNEANRLKAELPQMPGEKPIRYVSLKKKDFERAKIFKESGLYKLIIEDDERLIFEAISYKNGSAGTSQTSQKDPSRTL